MVGMSRNQQQVFSRLMKFDQRHFQIEHDAVNAGLHLIGRFALETRKGMPLGRFDTFAGINPIHNRRTNVIDREASSQKVILGSSSHHHPDVTTGSREPLGGSARPLPPCRFAKDVLLEFLHRFQGLLSVVWRKPFDHLENVRG